MIDSDTIQAILVTVGTLAMGFYFGSQFAGRQAKPIYMGEMPAWLQTVKTVNAIVLCVFAVALLGVVAIERSKTSS